MGCNAMVRILLPLALAAYPLIPVADTLKIEGIARDEKVVVMLTARAKDGAAKCRESRKGSVWVFRASSITELGNMRSSEMCRSELAIFSENHAVFIEPITTWTNESTDIHTVTLRPIIEVPVSVWIANTVPGAMTKARNDVARANALYKQNRAGIRFVPTIASVSDAALEAINGSVGKGRNDIECRDIPGIQRSVFYTPNRLNVYYVTLNITGRNCAIRKTPTKCPGTNFEKGDANITYIGTAANRATLAHEFGHAFGLRPGPCGGHTDGRPGFRRSNIMWGGGDADRDRFTLGQVFRMNTQKDEWDGTMLIQNGLRIQADRRECPPLTINAACPALKKDWPRR
jgi:hypothetical protein